MYYNREENQLIVHSNEEVVLVKRYDAPTPDDEPESMRWTWGDANGSSLPSTARQIVAWVKRNGGKARYEPSASALNRPSPRIAVRTRDGDAYCAPGQRVVKGELFCLGCGAPLELNQHPCDGWGYPIREFTVTDDATRQA